MLKRNEVSSPNSCLNKASDDSTLFVLKDSDAAMADTIRFWISRRVELGLNKEGDAKLVEAAQCAAYCDSVRKLNLPSE